MKKTLLRFTVILGVAAMAAILAWSPSYDHHSTAPTAPSSTTNIITIAPSSCEARDCSAVGMAMGTFATEKLRVTGTGSDSIVAAGGMQMQGSAFIVGNETLNGVLRVTPGVAGSQSILADSIDVAAIQGTRTLTASTTDNWATIEGVTTGTMNATIANIYNIGVRGSSTVTKSGGAGNLHDWGVLGKVGTEGGAPNVAYELLGVTGVAFEGSTYSIGGSFRSGTQNGQSFAVYGQGDHSTGGNSVGMYGFSRTGGKRIGLVGVAATSGGSPTGVIGIYATAGPYTETFPTGTYAAYLDGASLINGALDMTTHLVNNVVDPVSAQDAATKNYVDTHAGLISGLTTNTIPKATSATSIGNSLSTDDGTTFAINVNKFTVTEASGNALIAGTGDVTGDFKVNTTSFTVAASSGNTVALGTLTADSGLRVFDVAGAGLTSTTNTVDVIATTGGGLTVNPNDVQMTFCAANQVPTMNGAGTAWTCATPTTGTVTGTGTANTMTKWTGTSAIGNSAVTDNATTFAINVNKFTVTEASGNTLIAGTGDVTGDFKVNTTSFTVAASSGNTVALGTLTADSGLRVFDVAGAGLTSTTNTVNVIAAAGGGLTVNADSVQMTFCAANQAPVMNGAGTSWGCVTPATISGSITSPGVVYASGANTAATDATNFTYYQPEVTVNIGTQAVTTCGGGACDTSLNVTSGTAAVAPVLVWNTNTAGYSAVTFENTAATVQSGIGFANSTVALTNYRSLNYLSSTSADWIFAESTGGSVIARVFMTSGSAGFQLANGSSGAAGTAATGKVIYNNTTKTMRVSLDNAAFTDVITGAVAANTIPKSNSTTTGALTASLVTDNGTTFAINTNKFTVTEASGNTLIAGTGDVTGDFKVNTNKFTVTASSGNTLIAGTGDVTGDFKVNTNKFTVTASSGNTVVAGTLNVTSSATVDSILAQTATFSVTAAGAATFGTIQGTDITASGTVTGKFLSGDVAGSPPTVTSCGTSPTQPAANDTNLAGTFTTGTSSSGACTITFAGTWPNAPICTLQANASAVAFGVTGARLCGAATSCAFTSLGDSTAYIYQCFR